MAIIIIDDDDAVRDSLKTLLSLDYDDVKDFASCRRFLAGCHPGESDALILDIHLPEMGGFELMEQLAARGIRVPVILITGRPDQKIRARATELGAIALLDKPVDYEALRFALERARSGADFEAD
jgi:FixJ family two-component response regulator